MGRPRKYSDAEREQAVAIFAVSGAQEAARATGIPASTIADWAAGMVALVADIAAQVPNASARDKLILLPTPTETTETETTDTPKPPSDAEYTAALIEEQHQRLKLRTRWLEVANEALDRINQPHVDFKGKDADMVTYPRAPDGAFRNYVVSAAVALDKYRLEMNEAGSKVEVDFRGRIAAVAIQMGYDPAEVQAEAERLMLGDGT